VTLDLNGELFIAIDEDTLKLKIDNSMWSIPYDLEPQNEPRPTSDPVERTERKIVDRIGETEHNQHGVPYRWVYFTDGTNAPTWPNGSINEILAQYENYIGNEVEISFYAGLITNMEVW
jgi:hypothetical protein